MCHEDVRTQVLIVCQLPSMFMEQALDEESPIPDMPDMPDIPDILEWSCEVIVWVEMEERAKEVGRVYT